MSSSQSIANGHVTTGSISIDMQWGGSAKNEPSVAGSRLERAHSGTPVIELTTEGGTPVILYQPEENQKPVTVTEAVSISANPILVRKADEEAGFVLTMVEPAKLPWEDEPEDSKPGAVDFRIDAIPTSGDGVSSAVTAMEIKVELVPNSNDENPVITVTSPDRMPDSTVTQEPKNTGAEQGVFAVTIDGIPVEISEDSVDVPVSTSILPKYTSSEVEPAATQPEGQAPEIRTQEKLFEIPVQVLVEGEEVKEFKRPNAVFNRSEEKFLEIAVEIVPVEPKSQQDQDSGSKERHFAIPIQVFSDVESAKNAPKTSSKAVFNHEDEKFVEIPVEIVPEKSGDDQHRIPQERHFVLPVQVFSDPESAATAPKLSSNAVFKTSEEKFVEIPVQVLPVEDQRVEADQEKEKEIEIPVKVIEEPQRRESLIGLIGDAQPEDGTKTHDVVHAISTTVFTPHEGEIEIPVETVEPTAEAVHEIPIEVALEKSSEDFGPDGKHVATAEEPLQDGSTGRKTTIVEEDQGLVDQAGVSHIQFQPAESVFAIIPDEHKEGDTTGTETSTTVTVDAKIDNQSFREANIEQSKPSTEDEKPKESGTVTAPSSSVSEIKTEGDEPRKLSALEEARKLTESLNADIADALSLIEKKEDKGNDVKTEEHKNDTKIEVAAGDEQKKEEVKKDEHRITTELAEKTAESSPDQSQPKSETIFTVVAPSENASSSVDVPKEEVEIPVEVSPQTKSGTIDSPSATTAKTEDASSGSQGDAKFTKTESTDVATASRHEPDSPEQPVFASSTTPGIQIDGTSTTTSEGDNLKGRGTDTSNAALADSPVDTLISKPEVTDPSSSTADSTGSKHEISGTTSTDTSIEKKKEGGEEKGTESGTQVSGAVTTDSTNQPSNASIETTSPAPSESSVVSKMGVEEAQTGTAANATTTHGQDKSALPEPTSTPTPEKSAPTEASRTSPSSDASVSPANEQVSKPETPSTPRAIFSAFKAPPEEEKDDEIQWIAVPADGSSSIQSTPRTSVDQKPDAATQKQSEVPTANGFASEEKTEDEPKKVVTFSEPTKKSEDDFMFNIDEYEKKLQKTSQEAIGLVEKLAETQKAINDAHHDAVKTLSEQVALDRQDKENRIDFSQLPPPPSLPNSALGGNIESVLIGDGILKCATGALVLPSGLVLVTDHELGLLLFTQDSQLVSKVMQDDWRFPQSPVLFRNYYILVLMQVRGEDGQFSRHIVKFSLKLEYMGKIEGPKWVRESSVVSERLAISATENIYLSVHAELFSALYELTPGGLWTELLYKLSEAYADMIAFSVIGPITQILIVDEHNNFVWMVSVREHEVVERRRLYIGDRPWALGRDEAGRLFAIDRRSSAIRLVDTICWVPAKAVGIVDTAMASRISAGFGLLAVPLKTRVRLQKYEFE